MSYQTRLDQKLRTGSPPHCDMFRLSNNSLHSNHSNHSNDSGVNSPNVFQREQMPQQLQFKTAPNPRKASMIFTNSHSNPRLNFRDSTGGLKKLATTPPTLHSHLESALKFKCKNIHTGLSEELREMAPLKQVKSTGDPAIVTKPCQSQFTTGQVNMILPSRDNQLQHQELYQCNGLGRSQQFMDEFVRKSKPDIEAALKECAQYNASSQRYARQNIINSPDDNTRRLNKYRNNSFNDVGIFANKVHKQSPYFQKHTTSHEVYPQQTYANISKQALSQPTLPSERMGNDSLISVQSGQSNLKVMRIEGFDNFANQTTSFYYSYPHPKFINPYKSQPPGGVSPSATQVDTHQQHKTHPVQSHAQQKACITQNQIEDKPKANTPNSLNSNFAKFKPPSHSSLRSSSNKATSALKERNPEKKGAKLSDFHMGKKLGRGKFGDVFLAKHKVIHFVCALKIIKKKTLLDEKVDAQFIRELKIQSYLNHPNLISLYAFFDDEINFYMLLEFATDSHLFGALREKKRLSEQETKTIIRQVCQGVEYMHSQRILHRDLKPQNILIQFGIPKICDFGWSVYRADTLRDTFCGTPLYISPQILTGEKYDEGVDLWAVGILTYQLLVGKIPFKIKSEQDLVKIVTQDIVFPENLPLSLESKDFVMHMLERNPTDRFDIEELLSHPFMAKGKEPIKTIC